MKQHGDTIAGKKIEIVQKDTTSPAPDVAKRLAQELVTRDNVDLLVGFALTPNALAVATNSHRSKEADGDHGRRDVDHHHTLALYCPRVDDAAADHPADGPVGGHDRPGYARHRADRLHPQGREGRRKPLQRGVRQVPGPEGPREVKNQTSVLRKNVSEPSWLD